MDKNKCPKIKTQFTFDFLKIVPSKKIEVGFLPKINKYNHV